MTANSVRYSKEDCPVKDYHGNPFRYCGSCNWSEETDPAPSPPYVLDMAKALVTGQPLDFQGHEVPLDVQQILKEMGPKPQPLGDGWHACAIDAERDTFAYKEQYLVGCQCHEGNTKHIWQPGDAPFVCPTSGITVADVRTLIPAEEPK